MAPCDLGARPIDLGSSSPRGFPLLRQNCRQRGN